MDANLLTVTRRPPRLMRDAQAGTEALVTSATSAISDVDPTVLHLLCAARMVPVIASLAADNDGALYNVNADSDAASIAGAFDAAKFFLLTNAEACWPTLPTRPRAGRSSAPPTATTWRQRGSSTAACCPKCRPASTPWPPGCAAPTSSTARWTTRSCWKAYLRRRRHHILHPADKAAYLAGRSEPVVRRNT